MRAPEKKDAHRPTPGPPTARISLNRRVQLRTFITFAYEHVCMYVCMYMVL